MFSEEKIRRAADANQAGLHLLGEAEEVLNGRFYDVKVQVRGLILAVATGEPLLFIGPPGTAKSRLVRSFCELLGIAAVGGSQSHHKYFEYLLNPFTEPAELFGYYDIAELSRDHRIKRLDQHALQKATVVFLDEVFNASSALMNSLLAVMNERVLHDRGERIDVQMQCLFSATNNVPQSNELLAFFDRYLFRVRVDNTGVEKTLPASFRDPQVQTPTLVQAIPDLLKHGWRETFAEKSAPQKKFHGLLGQMKQLQDYIRKHSTGELQPETGASAFSGNLAHVVSVARQYGLSQMSNRRLIKIVHAMLVHRMYRHAALGETQGGIGAADFDLIWTYCLDRTDPIPIERMRLLYEL